MASRAKKRTYGKKKGKDIIALFDCLSLTPSPTKGIAIKPRLQREILGQLAQGKVTRNHTPEVESKDLIYITGREDSESRNSTGRGSEPAAVKQLEFGEPASPPRGRKPRYRRQPEQKHTRKLTCHIEHDPALSASRLNLPSLPPELSTLLSLPYVHPNIKNFTMQYNTWAQTLTFRKIAQGSYGSILRLSLTSQPELYTIWKLMPLKPKTGKGSRQVGATRIHDAIAELKVLEDLSKSPGFVEFRSAQVMRGVLPEGVREVHTAWESGLTEKEREELEEVKGYEDEQMWLFIEMTDAGTDLETLLKRRLGERRYLDPRYNRGLIDILEAWDIFWGIAEALAHGEEHAEFEHRDLHPGNVCIRRRSRAFEDSLNNEPQGLVKRFTDLEVTLIDYTLSRATIRHKTGKHVAEAEIEVLANSMQDQALFHQTSEIEIDQMQYDIYRRMRDILHSHRKGRRKADGWQSYMPLTNVLWLQHILRLLLKETGVFSAKWSLNSTVSLENWRRTAAFRLDGLRRAMDPEKMWECAFQSATDLVRDEIMKTEVTMLCEALEDVSVSHGFENPNR
ncbi:MAG: hypothetical protein Q9217_002729 [Psora testacea]